MVVITTGSIFPREEVGSLVKNHCPFSTLFFSNLWARWPLTIFILTTPFAVPFSCSAFQTAEI